MNFLADAAPVLIYILITLLCLAGLILSCISISGTWLICIASLVTFFLPAGQFAGWPCIIVFILLAGLIEVLEFVAASLGVERLGGSRLAGLMAVVGGIMGLILGGLIPVPVIGSLIGMMIGSFACVYAVEYRRLKTHSKAANIATGTIIARLAIILLKVMAALGMTVYLALSLVF